MLHPEKSMVAMRQPLHSTTRGILWMLCSCFIAGIFVSLARQASLTQHPFEIVFFRNIFAMLCFVPWVYRRGVKRTFVNLKAGQFRWHAARALCGIAGMLTWFYAISVVDLPLATALSFTAPLFTAMLAVLVFKEQYGFHRWAALAIGFLGTVVILRPGTEHFEPVALIVLVSTVFWAISGMIIKRLTQRDDPILVAFYLTVLVTPLALPFALFVWKTPTWEDMGWFVLIGIAASAFQITLSKAIAATEFAVILPFDFTRLIFVSIFAYFWFGQVIDQATLVGSVMILAGAAYTAYKNRQHRIRREAQIIPDEVE
jgi:drug/metabolite transporter (DMT)-like permease